MYKYNEKDILYDNVSLSLICREYMKVTDVLMKDHMNKYDLMR